MPSPLGCVFLTRFIRIEQILINTPTANSKFLCSWETRIRYLYTSSTVLSSLRQTGIPFDVFADDNDRRDKINNKDIKNIK